MIKIWSLTVVRGLVIYIIHPWKTTEKVVAGTNYLMTVLVGHSNCTTDAHFNTELCPVVNKDKR